MWFSRYKTGLDFVLHKATGRACKAMHLLGLPSPSCDRNNGAIMAGRYKIGHVRIDGMSEEPKIIFIDAAVTNAGIDKNSLVAKFEELSE